MASGALGHRDRDRARRSRPARSTVLLGSGSHGQGLETTMAQVVAEHLGVDSTTSSVVQGDTDARAVRRAAPAAAGTAVIAGGAARAASLEVARRRSSRSRRTCMEAAPDDLEIDDGRDLACGARRRAVTLAEVAHVAYHDAGAAPRRASSPASRRRSRTRRRRSRGRTRATCAPCEVDRDTGRRHASSATS